MAGICYEHAAAMLRLCDNPGFVDAAGNEKLELFVYHPDCIDPVGVPAQIPPNGSVDLVALLAGVEQVEVFAGLDIGGRVQQVGLRRATVLHGAGFHGRQLFRHP